MKFIPHNYQLYAVRYIIDHPIAAVFLDMGLGLGQDFHHPDGHRGTYVRLVRHPKGTGRRPA